MSEFCSNCPCDSCTLIRDTALAKREKQLRIDEATRQKLAERAARREQADIENDQFDCVLWMLVSATATDWRSEDQAIYDLAIALDLTTSMVRSRVERYRLLLVRKTNEYVLEEPSAGTLRLAAAGALPTRASQKLHRLHAKHRWLLPKPRPVCPDCGQNLRHHKLKHVYGKCPVTGVK